MIHDIDTALRECNEVEMRCERNSADQKSYLPEQGTEPLRAHRAVVGTTENRNRRIYYAKTGKYEDGRYRRTET